MRFWGRNIEQLIRRADSIYGRIGVHSWAQCACACDEPKPVLQAVLVLFVDQWTGLDQERRIDGGKMNGPIIVHDDYDDSRRDTRKRLPSAARSLCPYRLVVSV